MLENAHDICEARFSRRNFLKLGALAAGVVCTPGLASALQPERSLSFYHTHTGETFKSVYWAEGHYNADALAEINHILRDYRTDEVKLMDTHLLDLLYGIGVTLGLDAEAQFHVVSGYRSPETNSMLRKLGRQVAKNSMHLKGRAVDIFLPGRAVSYLRKAAVKLKLGGVGYYPAKGFVHIDTGPVRYW
jgi:uncharacterized protein YcbK (DUF882 family)